MDFVLKRGIIPKTTEKTMWNRPMQEKPFHPARRPKAFPTPDILRSRLVGAAKPAF
jgi:hypothetical protein